MIALYLSGSRRKRVVVAEGDDKASFLYDCNTDIAGKQNIISACAAAPGIIYHILCLPDFHIQKVRVYGLGAEENIVHLSKEAQKLMERMDI